MKEVDQFFDFVNERERIRINKQSGKPWPWTDDPILQKFSFCNVFREDDRTTKFFRDTVREPLRNDPKVLMATIGWRWFNRIETCMLVDWLQPYSRERIERDLRHVQQGKYPLVTGAYVINTPTGVDKLTGILNCLDIAHNELGYLIGKMIPSTLETWHEQLQDIPHLGRFMAYEVVTDLSHTYLLESATDINTWASAGPGCIRGAGRVVIGDSEWFKYGQKGMQEAVLAVMQDLLQRSEERWLWPDKPWSMREVEHSLCEYQKYKNAQEGKRLKRTYKR